MTYQFLDFRIAKYDDVVVPIGARFAYVSAIGRTPLDSADYFYVDVQNTGDTPGTCTLEFYTNHWMRNEHYWYTGWELKAVVTHALQPGEIRTFGDLKECRCWVTGRDHHKMFDVKFVGEPGEISLGWHKAWA